MWTLGKQDQKELEASEIMIWRKTEMTRWTDEVRNEERTMEKRKILESIRKWKSRGHDITDKTVTVGRCSCGNSERQHGKKKLSVAG